MSALTSLLDAPGATALSWTLLHFLWQGTALAAAFFLVARYARLGSSARYTAGVLTLASMLAAPVATYLVVAPDLDGGAAATTIAMDRTPTVWTGAGVPLDAVALRSQEPVAPDGWPMTALVVGFWALGVCILAIRLAGGWLLARRLVHRAMEPASQEIQSIAVRIAGRLGLDRIVRVAQSSAVAVPVMVGWLKPVVLLPAAVLAGMTPTQIEALLAHELAHVSRHDYLVNLLPSVVETLLFYHPAVWWVSRSVRIEREHCCDDLAVGVCDRLVYATALSELATLSAPPRPALAATDGPLVERIRRILGAADHAQGAGSGWLPTLALAIVVGTVVPVLLASGNRPDGAAQSGSASGAVAGSAGAVQGGVPGGVPAGVPGGVPGGVRGGIAGTVPGGLEGGLPGGIEGGVPGGVTAGVSAGVEGQSGAPKAQSTATSDAQRRELAAQMEAIQRDAEQKAEELRKALQALEVERLDSQLKLQLAELSAQLEPMRKQLERMKQQVERGVMSPTDLGQLEAQITVLQQKMVAARTERALHAKELELRAAQHQQHAELSRKMEEYATMKRLFDEQAAASAGERPATGASILSGTVEVAAGERVRAGDVLTIEIRGEPDVPHAYSVRENGAIKLPLSPPLRVQGLTAQEVAQAVTKQLTARGLEGSAVVVHLRRHR